MDVYQILLSLWDPSNLELFKAHLTAAFCFTGDPVFLEWLDLLQGVIDAR